MGDEELYFLYFDYQFDELLKRASKDPFWESMALLGQGTYDEVAEKIDEVSNEILKKYLQSRYLYVTGQLQESLHLSREILQEDIVDYLRADLYRQSGNIYMRQSQLDKSLIYESKAIELFDKLGLFAIKYACMNNLGIIYGSKGDPYSAIKYYTQSLNYCKKNIAKNSEYRKSIIIFSLNIGSAKYGLKQFEESLKDARQVVEMAREYWMENKEDKNSLHLYSVSLSNIIDCLIETNRVVEAEQYLKIMHSLPQEYYRVSFTTMLATARILVESQRLRDHYKAEEILQDLIHDPQIDSQGLYFSRSILFKILLDEFKQTGVQEVLDEILDHLEKQLEISIIENIHPYRLEVLLIWARICVIESKLEKAMFLIDQVMEESSYLGITRIYDKAMKDRKYVENEIESLNEKSRKYQSLSDTIHTEKLQNYIKMVKEQLSH